MRTHGALALLVVTVFLAAPLAARAEAVTLRVTSGGTIAIQGGAQGTPGVAPDAEIDAALFGDTDPDAAIELPGDGDTEVNRTVASGPGPGPAVASRNHAKSNPELQLSFEGLNLFQQRFANGGNQFSVEPPDQALCVGNGFVVESVNDVLRVFDTAGNAVTGVVDLNSFYGYPAAIDRATGKDGPSITDPICLFDKDTDRFFHVVLTLDRVGTTAALSGKNHLDVAVSSTADPRDPWTVYRIPVQNDGTDGTPDHGCVRDLAGKIPGPCLGDYPHIGADANAIFLTTNEFDLFGPFFHAAQIYALPKRALAAGASAINVVLFDTGDPAVALDDLPGFTVWPAQSAGPHEGQHGGTEYLLSSQAVFFDDGTENRIRLYSVGNTKTIDAAAPALTLGVQYVDTITYAVPPSAPQNPGVDDTPLRDCLADRAIPQNPGRCFLRVGAATSALNPVRNLPANDSRMQQVFLANGKLWGALDTAVTVNGATSAGIAYFIVNPRTATVAQQGVLALDGANLTYPAVAATQSGRGVVAFTVVGPTTFPSAGYASLDAVVGAGDVHVAAAGAGPEDGFTGYRPLVATPRQRWGDYGAAALDGEDIWVASEYIAHTCTFAEYVSGDLTCGNTRAPLGNWSTRISKLRL
jgi:hypothetical protein